MKSSGRWSRRLRATRPSRAPCITSGKDSFLRRRRPHRAGALQGPLRRHARARGRGSRGEIGVRGRPQAVGAMPAAGNQRQAVGLRDQRHRHGRRLRDRACLPSPRRVRQSEDAARPAGGEGRPVPRRRRHPARCAHDPARRRAAVPAQGHRPQGRSRQGHEADRRGRARRPAHHRRQGVDQGRRQGRGAVGRQRLPPARRPGVVEGRHDDLHAGERHLPPRDLRQLSRRARHPAGGLRGPAGRHGHRACASNRAGSRTCCARRRRPT